MSTQPAKFVTARVSGVRTESHEPKTATDETSAAYVSLSGASILPPHLYLAPYPPGSVYNPQLPTAPARTHSPTGHTPPPPAAPLSHPPSHFLSVQPPAGSTSSGTAPSLSAIFTQPPSTMASPDSSTPSTVTSLPSAVPPITPDDGEDSPGGDRSGSPFTPGSVPRLPPIMQVEKVQVTTTATQAASASRRRNEAHFVCPVPGCGSTFTRRFNLRGGLRPYAVP
jgi:hypothetical protein